MSNTPEFADLFGWTRLEPFYLFAGGLLLSVLIAFLLVRWLPSGGILTVALGVRNTRRQFREPGVPDPAEKCTVFAGHQCPLS